MKSAVQIILLILILVGCKSGKQITSASNQKPSSPKSIASEPDTIYLVTQLGDTRSDLYEEVQIDTYRLLPDTIRLMAVGDIMMGTNFPNESYLPAKTGGYLWDDVRGLLSKADITFGNLEGTILDEGGEQKECNNPNLCYLFRSPEYLADHLTANGFDLISVANNHANDFGESGRRNTQKVLDRLAIAHAGSINQPFSIKKFGHLKVGFCAFAPNKGTMSIHDEPTIRQTIAYLDSLTDLVIVSLHMGAEGTKNRHITRKSEYYYGEDRGNVYELSHQLIDLGADVILGHGPHIVRAIELYNNRLIAYSLGNFLTYGRFNLKGYNGEAPVLDIFLKPTGEFLKGKIHSFRQSYAYGPRKDHHSSAAKTISQLSLEDFPDNPIFISELGDIDYLSQ